MNNSVNTSNNVIQSNTNNNHNNSIRFLVDTINDGTSSRYLYSPVTSVVPSENHNSYSIFPALAYVPNNSPIPVMPIAPIP